MESLVIDHRETFLIQRLEGLDIVFSKQNLAIGDILIHFPENKKIIMERKTLADLWSSILDGRFREQRSRLLEWRDGQSNDDGSEDKISSSSRQSFCLYLIEGDISQCPADQQDTLQKTLHRLVLVYHMVVWQVPDLKKSVEYIQWLCRQETLFNRSDPLKEQITNLSVSMKQKKQVQTPENLVVGLLQSLTGISYEIAKQVPPALGTEASASLKNFIEKLQTFSSKELAEITYKTKNGHQRRLGKEKSQRILSMLGWKDASM